MKSKIVKTLSSGLAAAVLIGMTGFIDPVYVRADWVKTSENTYFSTSIISDPVYNEDANAPWTGSYVYYGKYDGTPLRFRVLVSGRYGILLDCDSVLFTAPFDGSNPYTNDWNDIDCDIRNYINGEGFFTRENGLTDNERQAILQGAVYNENETYSQSSYLSYYFDSYTDIYYDPVFLLDAGDVCEPEFGYTNNPGWYTTSGLWNDGNNHWVEVPNRYKRLLGTDQIYPWLLRSAPCDLADTIGFVDEDGDINISDIDLDDYGISPALGLATSAVFSVSLVSGEAGASDAEYKMTLFTNEFGIYPGTEISIAPSDEGTVISVPYELDESIPGTVNRISYAIVPDEYSDGPVYYGEVEVPRTGDGKIRTTGTGTIRLPGECDYRAWREEYNIFVFAEDVNGQYETDYASEPVPLQPERYGVNLLSEHGSVSCSGDVGFAGEVITLSYETEEGYRFSGWEVVSGNTTVEENSFRFIDSDVVIRAIFEPVTNPSSTTPAPSSSTTTPAPSSSSSTPAPSSSSSSPTPAPSSSGAPTPAPGASETETGVAGFVERLYTVALGRPSDPVGKQDWIDAITLRGETGASAARGFLFSSEFLNKDISNEEFTRILYLTFFDREPDEAGFNAWVNTLNNGTSKQEVIEGFINSTEWANLCLRYGIRGGGTGTPNITVEPNQATIDFATRLYTTCLNRPADPEGLMAWASQLANQRETGTGAARGFFFSSEFLSQDMSNGEYVSRLYRTFMGREPDGGGFMAWVGQLDSGVSREEVFEGFAQSTEFAGICASYGIIVG